MISPERMAKGLYWDRAWKLVEGCTKVSPGCDNCWSETETVMRAGHPNAKISDRASEVLCDEFGPLGFGENILCREDNLDLPFRTKKPTVFSVWNDLFHKDVPDSFRDRAYAVMALCPQHTHLVLTKRAEGMAEYWNNKTVRANIRYQIITTYRDRFDQYDGQLCSLPKNVWHGVTAENQQAADERIPHLLRVPGKRFLSIEPMLGPVGMWFYGWQVSAWHRHGLEIDRDKNPIHAVLLGGESGSNARPMHPDWVHVIRDQCEETGVPFFFKQWGEWIEAVTPRRNHRHMVFDSIDSQPRDAAWMQVMESTIARPAVARIGKKKAGRTLDGRLHNDLPWNDQAARLQHWGG